MLERLERRTHERLSGLLVLEPFDAGRLDAIGAYRPTAELILLLGPLPQCQACFSHALAKDRREEVRSNTFEPWSMLPPREQQSRLRYGTERLSAIGEHGIDYETVVVYYTGFRLPLELLELDQAILVDRHRFAALNLVGPTQLTIEVARDGGARPDTRPETSSSDDAALEISSVSDGYVAPMSGTMLPVGSRVEINVPAGLHSMRLTTRSSQRFAVRVLGPKNAAFGAPAGIGEGEGRLRPDEIRISVLMSDSSDISLPIQIAGGIEHSNRGSRTLEFPAKPRQSLPA